MSILAELNSILSSLCVLVETGVFSGSPPDEYCVLTPLTEEFVLYGDNKPLIDVCEVRISLFSRHNYLATKERIIKSLISADFVITSRRYIGHEDSTSFHHVSIDVAKIGEWGG